VTAEAGVRRTSQLCARTPLAAGRTPGSGAWSRRAPTTSSGRLPTARPRVHRVSPRHPPDGRVPAPVGRSPAAAKQRLDVGVDARVDAFRHREILPRVVFRWCRRTFMPPSSMRSPDFRWTRSSPPALRLIPRRCGSQETQRRIAGSTTHRCSSLPRWSSVMAATARRCGRCPTGCHCATAVVQHGAGLAVPRTASAERIRAAIGALLADPRYRSQGQQVGRRIRAREGAAVAADLIDELGSRRNPVRS